MGKSLEKVKLNAVPPPTPGGILFRVGGGFGKNIMATRVAKQIAAEHPLLPLHVQASYPDAFANLDFVQKFYPMGVPLTDFYESHSDFQIVEAEPYNSFDYRCNSEHLVNVWCEKLGVNVPKSVHGIVNLTKQEIKSADLIIEQIKKQSGEKPLVGLQWIGGTSFYNPGEANNPARVQQVRELPQDVAQQICDDLLKAEKIPIIIGLPTEPRLKNAIALLDANGNAFPIRIVLAVISRLDSLIAVDSFAQHAWVALGKKDAVVLWGATRKNSLGYSQNVNLEPAKNCCKYGGGCGRPEMHVGDWEGNAQPWQCPYDSACMNYSAAEIVKKVK